QNMNGIPLLEHFDITGPNDATGPGDTPSRRRVFSCKPANAAEEPACARRILSTMARRAYRQPVSEADTNLLMSFYDSGRKNGNFERGIENALAFLLTAPKFLFRTESDPANVSPGGIYRVGDIDLASRLSFFLWSSIPDDELLNLASQGKLKDPAILDQ